MKSDAVTLWVVLGVFTISLFTGQPWAILGILGTLAVGAWRESWRPAPSKDLKSIVDQLNKNTERIKELENALFKVQADGAFGTSSRA